MTMPISKRESPSLSIRRTLRGRFRLEAAQWLPRGIGEVYEFFSDARNLDRITPPWMRFAIVTSDEIDVREGTLIDYRLRWHGLPLRWQSRISAWEPPARFVDEQLRGPYRQWVHEHTFTEEGGGTRVHDRVDYALPGGSLVNRFLVAPDLNRIFRYRHARLAEILGRSR